jgi:hypothetical protein
VLVGSEIGSVRKISTGRGYPLHLEAAARLVNASTQATLGLIFFTQDGTAFVILNSNASAPNFTWFQVPRKPMIVPNYPTVDTSHALAWSDMEAQSGLRIPSWLQLRHC